MPYTSLCTLRAGEPPTRGGAGQEHPQRYGGRQHRQPLRPGGAEGQQHNVTGHVGGEHPAQPEVAGGIDQPRDQG
jgi:hypothetical protein